MTAEPLPEWPDPLPDWFRPPPEGWTADHLDELPPGAPRMELIDGALIVMSPQTDFHSEVMRRLANALDDAAPDSLRVQIAMTVKLDPRQRPEPDIVVVQPQPNPAGKRRTYYLPDEVVLVVEIVSEESAERDRETKPLKYAKAGIKHFWRVEDEDGRPVVHVFELEEATGSYVATGIYRDRVPVEVPFAMDIDVKRLVRL
ncbi:Uma2 family endonuclease [Actinomadura kijaniata]|uniref:Uma2 family endonuclease n=1 Tax=Actinomadura kijaniata TaxID=46161 RepID=UPI000835A3DC|nr:Uma2 family endonuclease [Actinomadura kijaniata]